MKNKCKYGILIVIILFILFLSYDYLLVFFMKGGEIIPGKIVEYGPGGKDASISFKYEFFPNGQKHYKSTRYSNIFPVDGREFINKLVPVLRSKKIYAVRLLLTPKDFEKFDIPFPDSLHWVLNYIR